MHCNNCGTQNPADSEFCEKCGSKIEKILKKEKKPIVDKKKKKKKLAIILGTTIPIGIIIIVLGSIALFNHFYYGIQTEWIELSDISEESLKEMPFYNEVEWEDAMADLKLDEDEIEEILKKALEGSETFSGEEIRWSEAGNYIGETMYVYGPVINTYYDEDTDHKLTLLAIGEDFEESGCFVVVIEEHNRSNFPDAPEDYYMGGHITVYGEIIEYEGTPEIVIYNTDQIGMEGSAEGCQLTFDQDNINEISQEYLDEGYPYFSLHSPDGWDFNEYIDFYGYTVDSFGSLTTKLEKNSGGIIDSMPKFGIAVMILNDEYKATDDKSLMDIIFSEWWRDEISATGDIDEYFDEDKNIYSYVLGDSEDNQWTINYEIIHSGDDTFIYEVWGMGPEYIACIDYLVYSNIWDDERLYIEN